MPNILLLLTGGTICSRANASGRNFSDQATAAPQLIEQFQRSASPYAQTARFHSLAPLDILSENMTLPHWDKLLDCLRQVRWSDYQGLVIAHGTDTLAYTACLLALALNHPPLPVLLVSSDYNLQGHTRQWAGQLPRRSRADLPRPTRRRICRVPQQR